MADTTTTHELLVTTFATADALAKLLIEKRLITQEEFSRKLSAERATYQKLLDPTPNKYLVGGLESLTNKVTDGWGTGSRKTLHPRRLGRSV